MSSAKSIDSHPTEPTAYRALPSISALLADEDVRRVTSLSESMLSSVLREHLSAERAAIGGGLQTNDRDVRNRILDALSGLEKPKLAHLLNGTGVLIHTNLGRAPVSAVTAAAMADVAGGNVALEVDAESGRRGGRMREIATLTRHLTGAEATLVVNNNAAAVLLTLAALAAPGEVMLSRGEAVEIGGGFRIPDVLRQSGAKLVEVGTTNRTYDHDYRAAMTDETTAILKVHPSNFVISGFTHSASTGELASVGADRGLPVIEDLGSGALIDTGQFGLSPEPTIQAAISDGASIVTASGDKLLGGPQAGIICGRAALVERIAAHPLARALRADKTCLAGLAMTLRHYARGDALDLIPVWRMISAPTSDLRRRADQLFRGLVGLPVRFQVIETVATIGGGALPGATLPSFGLALSMKGEEQSFQSTNALARALRLATPAIFGRIDQDALIVDLRTILPEDDELLLNSIRTTAQSREC